MASVISVAPVGADETAPVTYRYQPEAYNLSDLPVSLSADGRSIGFASRPSSPSFARGTTATVTSGPAIYNVADQRDDGTRDLWSMEAFGYDAHHAVESHLSGDGLTYVATYEEWGGEKGDVCDPGNPAAPHAYYWERQIVRWQREDRESDFGDPELVSVADPAACVGVSNGHGLPYVGVGGDEPSSTPTVSDGGSVVAFASRARNFGASPTASVAALYVAEEDSGGQLVPQMVTPASLNGDVSSPMVSGDGDHIVFLSDASGLVSGVSPPSGGVLAYMATRDPGTPTTWDFEVVSQSTGGALASAGGGGAVIGGPTVDFGGERVAFVTDADNLDPSVEMPDEGPVVAVRHTVSDITRVVVNKRQPTGGLLHASHLGVDAHRAHISRDGERISVYARRAIGEGSQLLAFRADAAFSASAGERQSARLFSRRYEWGANIELHVAVEGGVGTSEDYVIAFPSVLPVDRSFGFHGSGLYFVAGRGLGHDLGRGWHGDPVDTANGAFRQDEIDLTAPPGAGPATIGRSYSSVGELSGMFGAGWRSALDEHLELDEDNGVVTLVNQNGARTTFVEETGAWRSADGSRSVLVPIVGGWEVRDPGGHLRSFDAEGLIVGWSAPGQANVELQRTGEVPAALVSGSGYEVELVDDTGYTWEWDPVSQTTVVVPSSGGDGFVDRAVSSDGRQVDYTYTLDPNGTTHLVSVSRPHAVGQAVGSFGVRTYEMSGDLLVGIVDQVDATRSKVVVENTYDALGRVVHQLTDTGDELDFAYGQKPDPFGVLVDAEGFTTVTNEASGDVTVYEYNERGEVVGITDAAGNTQSRSWATDRPDGSVSRSGVATDQVYDDAGRLEAVTQTAGATTRTIESLTYVVPDSSPAALTDDRVATRTDEAGVTTTFTYDGASRQPATVSTPCDPASTDAATPCPGSGVATTAYTYHSGPLAGLVASVTDPDGVVTEHTYAADRTLATTTTFDGATPLVTTYDTIRAGDPGWVAPTPAAVEVRTVETPGEAVTTEVFDAEGRLIESRDPLYDGTTHLATSYTYLLDGELFAVTDPSGGTALSVTTRAGDPGWAEAPGIAEVHTAMGPDGIYTITKTDRSGDVVVEQRGDPAVPGELATTTHTYGVLGRRTSTTDPMGVTTTFEYDAEGRVTDVIDEDGERTETAYDLFGRPTVVTDPLGQTTTTTYDAAGRVASVEDREGHDTTFTYDDAGRLHTTTDPRGGATEQRYTLAGRLAAETDATNRTTAYRYDTAGRQVEVELHSGATTTTTYDLDGRVATVTSPEGRVTTTTRDDLGRALTVTDPAAGTTTSTYWPTGEVKTRTDATGGQVEFTYDGGGRVVTVTDPLDRVTSYTYDSRGNRTRRTDALLGEREWHWNLADQLTSEVDPLDRTTSFTYDDLGRLDVRTDGAGRTETHGYDDAGQVTSLTYASGPATSFEYDDEGRRTKMVDATGTSLWHYNATGQMTGADLPGNRDLTFAWDLAGRRTVIEYPDGARYRNRYDLDGRLGEVEHDVAGTWVDVAVNDHDADGLLVEQDQGAGGLREWTHDPVTGRMTGYADTRGGTTTTTTLTHDAAGRIATETTGAVSTVYDYDDAGQLIEVDRSTGTDETYAYDELGRRTTATVGATTTTYQWDAASQLNRRVVNGSNHNYQYDASGRRTREAWAGGTQVLQWFWGARGTMTGQRHTAPGTVTDTARSTRGDGTLSALVTTVNGTTTDTTSLVWDPTLPIPQPVWTGDPGTTNATRAIYGPDLIRVDCPTGTGCTGPIPHDHHGSALTTPATAAITQDTTYTPWGDGGPTYTTGANHGYRSELHTGATIHLRARDYDPDTGLFLSPDPLDGIDGTTTINNPYHYTNNDPINYVDPLGLRTTDNDLIYEDPCAYTHDMFTGSNMGAMTLDQAKSAGYWGMGSHLECVVPTGDTDILGFEIGESGYCINDPNKCLFANDARNFANSLGESSGYPDDDGGPYNAVRHMGWAAVMTVFLGADAAHGFLTTHEVESPNIFNRRFNQADQANNWYGVEIGRRVARETGAPSYSEWVRLRLYDSDKGLRIRGNIEAALSTRIRDFVAKGLACQVVHPERPSNDPSRNAFVSDSRCGYV